ncbi:LysR substrate-binding domain-containing protein [Limnohabitans sp.]|uniref:LysR substrate-binding domain-containing protein n=1 Tax=Limnohabitans sp. TaxID=1907725 RepID=UPI002FDE1F03
MKRLPPLNALRAFHVTAQLGSLTKAGTALHVTQGAVSRQVKLLEDALGRPLFFRVHQGIKLTETGKLLAEGLQSTFSGLEQLIEHITQDQRRQQISINIPPTFATRWLAPRLSKFCSIYPFVDLHITTNWVQSLRDSESHDCLVVFDTAPWPKVECELLMYEKHVMVSDPKLWRHDLPPTLSQQTLLHILNGPDRLPVWERWIERHNLEHIDPKPGLSFSTLDQAINAALSGAGVAIVDEHMIRPELSSGALRLFNDLHMDGPYGYWFVDVAKDGEHKAVIRLIRDWLRQEFASASS